MITRKQTQKKKPAQKEKRAPVRPTRVLTRTSGSSCFWVHNGPVIESVDGLKRALRTMSGEQFAHHTKRNGNDFAAWLKEVLHHSGCAAKVARAKTPSGACRALGMCSD